MKLNDQRPYYASNIIGPRWWFVIRHCELGGYYKVRQTLLGTYHYLAVCLLARLSPKEALGAGGARWWLHYTLIPPFVCPFNEMLTRLIFHISFSLLTECQLKPVFAVEVEEILRKFELWAIFLANFPTVKCKLIVKYSTYEDDNSGMGLKQEVCCYGALMWCTLG